jgi:DNA-binding CsgD family transcriptional regulator
MFFSTQDKFDNLLNPVPLASNSELSWFLTIADNVSYGIGLISTDLQVMFINKQAKASLEGYGESLTPDRFLNSGSPSSQMARLISAVRQAKDGTKQMVLFQNHESQLAIAVSPIELPPGKTCILITPERVGSCDKLSLTSYGRILGLTHAEIRVLERLTDGQDPTEAAKNLNISVPTIRTHIKSILGKTDSNCLRSLVLRVAKLPPFNNSAGSITA